MTDSLFSRIRHWIFEEALPFWSVHGVDGHYGGYVEQLSLDGADAAVPFKRVRVIGRQMYVFSHAALIGRPDCLESARHGFEFLTRKVWLGPEAGWARLLNRDGSIKDASADLYDNAFILFGLGWYFRASRDPEALKWIDRTVQFITRRMRHPSGRGFCCELPDPLPRKQNPHMHLLEAALVNLEATGDARFRAIADEIVALFCEHFYDPPTQTLGECFNEDWSRATEGAGRAIEPGHQFEWAWILANYERATKRDLGAYVRGLVGFAESFGLNAPTGATYNVVGEDGTVLNDASRTWPNTERLKAAVALFELEGKDPRPVFKQSGELLLRHYLQGIPAGAWMDEFDVGLAPLSKSIPASTLYHLFLAFAEVLRVEAAVNRAFAN